MRWLVLVSLGLSGCLMPGVALVDSFGDGGSGASGGSGADGSGGKTIGGNGATGSGGSLGEAGDDAAVEGGNAGMDVGGTAGSGGDTSTAGSGGTTAGNGGTAGSGGTLPATNPHAWANWPMPNPVGSPGPNFASYNTDQPGIVLDNVTGLVWQAVVSRSLLTYVQAETYCAGLSLSGQSDWRVPTRIELVSLVDYTVARPGPTIDQSAFPGEPAEPFWSASQVWGNLDYAYTVWFQDGTTNTDMKTDINAVRCVRP